MKIQSRHSGASDQNGLTLEQALAAYRETYLASRNLAPRTRREYLTDLGQLCYFLAGSCNVTTAQAVERTHLEAFLAHLDQRHLGGAGGGCIINLSSIFGMISMPYNASKLASKGAVQVMTKTDALLYAQDRIRVNSVHPGPVLVGDMVARSSPEDLEALRRKLESLILLGHLGEPDDVAYGIVYLASDEAKFVTGSELVIDGGYTAR